MPDPKKVPRKAVEDRVDQLYAQALNNDTNSENAKTPPTPSQTDRRNSGIYSVGLPARKKFHSRHRSNAWGERGSYCGHRFRTHLEACSLD